jgi:hypothetical protein
MEVPGRDAGAMRGHRRGGPAKQRGFVERASRHMDDSLTSFLNAAERDGKSKRSGGPLTRESAVRVIFPIRSNGRSCPWAGAAESTFIGPGPTPVVPGSTAPTPWRDASLEALGDSSVPSESGQPRNAWESPSGPRAPVFPPPRTREDGSFWLIEGPYSDRTGCLDGSAVAAATHCLQSPPPETVSDGLGRTRKDSEGLGPNLKAY